MENVSIDSSEIIVNFCTVYVSFKYEWTKTTNKNHKNHISILYFILQCHLSYRVGCPE